MASSSFPGTYASDLTGRLEFRGVNDEPLAAQRLGDGRIAVTGTGRTTIAGQVVSSVDHVGRALGGADVLINNAGLLLDENGNVLEVDVQRFRDCMETNVYGPLRLAQALLPGMISRGYGRVVNVSSGAGQIATMSDYAPPYSLSKAA